VRNAVQFPPFKTMIASLDFVLLGLKTVKSSEVMEKEKRETEGGPYQE